MTPQKRLLIALLALVGVFLMGTLGFYLIEDDVSFGDAAYMTLITISTVGYGEQWKLSDGAHLWTAIIILVGIMVVTLAFASLQAMIVGGELRGVLGRRKLKDRIGKLSGHYIVCGYGRMGRQIARDLSAKGKKVVVIESDENRTAHIGDDGFDYVPGDASEEEVLHAAGIDRAAGLVTVVRSDAENVFVTLTARGIRDDLSIISRAESTDSAPKLKRAGATRVICPQAIGASRIVNLLARPGVAKLVDITMGGTEYEIEEVVIQPGSKLVGRTLRDLNLRATAKIMVVAVHRADGETAMSPDADHVVEANDVMVVICPAGAAESLVE